MTGRMRPPGALAVTLLTVACSGEPSGVTAGSAPAIEYATVAPNPHNVLGATVTVRVRDADSVAVVYHDADAATISDSTTPAMRTVGDFAAIPVLGLLSERRYALRAVAWGPGGSTVGGSLELVTGALPADLPGFTASGSDPSPGFVVFSAGAYGLVIDNSGRVVWYRRFPNGPGLAFMAQQNGRYATRPRTPDVADIEPWVELDPSGNVTRSLGCALGLQPRLHDLIAEPDGSYWLMCDESRTMDLTAMGGVSNARVIGTTVQHLSASGALLFRWSPFDHFEITDLELAERTGPTVNWTHGNAIDLGADGKLIVSFRSLGEISKIDVATGAVIWRLGGLRNQFTFVNTATPAFARQHGARAASGTLLLLDNTGDPTESHVERYVVDEGGRTARLVSSYGRGPGVVTQIGGSVQDLPGGRALVSFGTAGRVAEFDAAGRVVWEIVTGAGYVFRAQRIRSLYAPGVGTAR